IFIFRFIVYHFSRRRYTHRAARMIDFVSIISYTVHGNYKSLIFNCSRRNQLLPMLNPRIRPAGNIKQDIIFSIKVSRPGWEAKVITNQRTDFPPFQLHQDLLVSRSEDLVFLTQTKEVMFVIFFECSVRAHPDQTIIILTVFFDDQASRYYAVEFL